MSQPGMGVMIGMLGCNEETVTAIKASLGKEITGVSLKDDRLLLKFSDDKSLSIYDDGQSCCEHRYMTTEDDLAHYVGAQLLDVELAEGPTVDEDYEEHEVAFLRLRTSKGVLVLETHNEHNGYYGGFWVVAREIVDATD